jgi:hypothetical protein
MREDIISDRFVANSSVTSRTVSCQQNIYFKAVENNSFELSTLNTRPEIIKAFSKVYNKPKKDILVIDGGDRIIGMSIDLMRELREYAHKHKIAIVVSMLSSVKSRRKSSRGSLIDGQMGTHFWDGLFAFPTDRMKNASIKNPVRSFGVTDKKGDKQYYIVLLKPVSKFYTLLQLCNIGIESILKGIKK